MPEKTRVLVADDSPTIVRLLEMGLTSAGYEVVSVPNGYEALTEIYRRPPDVAILDIIMPLMTGYQVCRILKNHQRFQEIPVIMFTTLEDREKEFRAFQTGAEAYLRKPVDIGCLVFEIERLISGRPPVKVMDEHTRPGMMTGGTERTVKVEEILFEVNEILDERLHEMSVFKAVSSLVRSVDSHRGILAEFFALLRKICAFSLGMILQVVDEVPMAFIEGDDAALDPGVIESMNGIIIKAYNGHPKRSGGVLDAGRVETVIVGRRQGTVCGGPLQSVILEPMEVKGSIVGVIAVASFREGAFTGHTRRLLDFMSDQAAAIFDHARIFEDLQHFSKTQTVRLETVYEIGRLMSSTMDVSDMLSIIVEVITKVMKCAKCSLFMIDRRTMNFFMKLGVGVPPEVLMDPNLKIDDSSVSGWVITSRKPLLIKDIDRDARFSGRERKGTYESSSLMCVPIISRETVLGVINVTDRTDHRVFKEEDLELLSMLGNLVAVIIENTKLYNKMKITIDKLNRKNWEITTLFTLDDFLTSLGEVDELLKYSAINAARFSESDVISVHCLEDFGEGLVIRAIEGDENFAPISAMDVVRDALLSEVFETGKPVLADPSSPGKADGMLTRGEQPGIGSAMAIPMSTDLGTIGAFVFLRKSSAQPFSGEELKFMSTMVAFVTKRLERLRMYNLVVRDPATGAYQERFFTLRLRDEMRRARRYGRSICVVTASIDDMGMLDSIYEPIEKDRLLSGIVRIFRQTMRTVDSLGAISPGVFAVILPETDQEGGRKFSLRVMKGIAESGMDPVSGKIEEQSSPVTLSIGLAGSPPMMTDDHGEMLAAAISAAEGAHHEGGNRIQAHGEFH